MIFGAPRFAAGAGAAAAAAYAIISPNPNPTIPDLNLLFSLAHNFPKCNMKTSQPRAEGLGVGKRRVRRRNGFLQTRLPRSSPLQRPFPGSKANCRCPTQSKEL